ncbi:MAG: hypothetical protein OXN17_01680 [Candidatus Poribacteria bacterium]|nr:hypothetical protein [Candidatus Poribacteria bacterium]MDE0505234.1 hypothetical protein [Candidatus Poribacteria bacterium]
MTTSRFIFFLAAFWIALPFVSCTSEESISEETPSLFFPNAQNFVLKNLSLSVDEVSSIERALGAKLKSSDLSPAFHIATNSNNKPLGAVLFLKVDGQQGEIRGGVGLNMQGKVVRVEILENAGTTSTLNREFLDQFTGMGIENVFQVGTDVKPIAGHQEISQSVALLPQKALLMTYALFSKESEHIPESTGVPEEPPDEVYEPETLIELMEMMKDEYIVVREYLRSPTDRNAAIKAAKQLEYYIAYIDYFEPPNNPNETEEYAYFQDQLSTSLARFVDILEIEGASTNSNHQWETILDLVNKAHLRFSIDDVDLDEDLD